METELFHAIKRMEERALADHHQPNILWYCTDQQRWDTVAALGNAHIHTPTLDRLVDGGVAFERAYTQSPICTPSRATFLTGRYPATHQVHRNGADFFPDSETLVTRLLADAGYDCGLAGKLHLSRAKDRIEKRPDDGYRFYRWSHHPNPDWPEGHDYAEWLHNEKSVDPYELCRKHIHLYGSWVYTYGNWAQTASVMKATYKTIDYPRLVTHHFALEQAQEALETAHRQESMKAAIVPFGT